jgi:hypothetical protein
MLETAKNGTACCTLDSVDMAASILDRCYISTTCYSQATDMSVITAPWLLLRAMLVITDKATCISSLRSRFICKTWLIW